MWSAAGDAGMTEVRAPSILARKVEAGKARAGPSVMTSGKALSAALARTAQDMIGLPLSVKSIVQKDLSLTEMLDLLEDRALLAALEADDDAMGLIALGPTTLSALVEMQTLGRLGASETSPRRPTRTDAAMSADFIEKSLSSFSALLSGQPDGGQRFHYASFIEDARPLALMLEDVVYRVFEATVLLGAGPSREGRLLLALPATVTAAASVMPAAGQPMAAPLQEEGTEAWAKDLRATIMDAAVSIEAVLCRLSLPLASVLSLSAGAVLPLSDNCLARVSLVGSGGLPVSAGRLGQAGGHRAIRVSQTAIVKDYLSGNTVLTEVGAPPGLEGLSGLTLPEAQHSFPAAPVRNAEQETPMRLAVGQ